MDEATSLRKLIKDTPKTAKCQCAVHLKIDKELEKEGKTPSKCLGHGEGCPCYGKAND